MLDATSVGSIAYSRLKEAEEGTIHGVYDGAINILLAGGLISVVPEAVERGPLNITVRLPVESPTLSFLGLRAGEKVEVQGSVLKLGSLHRISFGSAETYSPKRRFGLRVLDDDGITANLEDVKETALLSGNMAGLGGLLTLLGRREAGAKAGKLNIFASAALPRIGRLEQAFRSGDKDLLTDAIIELTGLGPGLTPSSDDMIAGLVLLCALYAANSGRTKRASRLIAEVTASEVRGRTTILSEEYLRQAASGRGNEPVMRLCIALLTGDRESVRRETRRVLAIGETSGTDIVLGIVLGTMLCTGRRLGFESEESR